MEVQFETGLEQILKEKILLGVEPPHQNFSCMAMDVGSSFHVSKEHASVGNSHLYSYPP